MSSGYLDNILKKGPVRGPTPAPGEPIEDNVVPLPVAELAAPDSSGKEAYLAFEEFKVKKRYGGAKLRVHFGRDATGRETIALFSYSYLREVLCTSPEFLSLVFVDTVIMLEGRNLVALIEPLEEDNIRRLRPFDARFYAPPSADAPVIHRVTRVSMREFMANIKDTA